MGQVGYWVSPIPWGKWATEYPHTMGQVGYWVPLYHGASRLLSIPIPWGKWATEYPYTMGQVGYWVSPYHGASGLLSIPIPWGKRATEYPLYHAASGQQKLHRNRFAIIICRLHLWLEISDLFIVRSKWEEGSLQDMSQSWQFCVW